MPYTYALPQMKVNTEAPTLRRRWLLPLALAVLLAGIAADAFLIEPYWLKVNSYEIAARVTAPLKIATYIPAATDAASSARWNCWRRKSRM
jgi:hypothetical protein